MKIILGSTLAAILGLGVATSALARDAAVEEAWRNNTRGENVPHEWAIAEREAKSGELFASSGAIQFDAVSQSKTQIEVFPDVDKPWLWAH